MSNSALIDVIVGLLVGITVYFASTGFVYFSTRNDSIIKKRLYFRTYTIIFGVATIFSVILTKFIPSQDITDIGFYNSVVSSGTLFLLTAFNYLLVNFEAKKYINNSKSCVLEIKTKGKSWPVYRNKRLQYMKFTDITETRSSSHSYCMQSSSNGITYQVNFKNICIIVNNKVVFEGEMNNVKLYLPNSCASAEEKLRPTLIINNCIKLPSTPPPTH